GVGVLSVSIAGRRTARVGVLSLRRLPAQIFSASPGLRVETGSACSPLAPLPGARAEKIWSGPLHRATPPLAVRRGQVDQIRSGSIAAIGWTCRQCGGSGTGGAVEGPPLGLFFRRAPGSGANGVLAERVSTHKPGPRKKSPQRGVGRSDRTRAATAALPRYRTPTPAVRRPVRGLNRTALA